MAKSKYESHVAPRLEEIRDWARNGLTDDIIIERLGISRTAFYDYKNKFADFANALKESKEVCDGKVESALYQAAINGNITAMIFWLKNRRAYKWREHPDFIPDNPTQKLDKLCEAITAAIRSDTNE